MWKRLDPVVRELFKVHGAPQGLPNPISPHAQKLPYEGITWQRFEGLCLRLLSKDPDLSGLRYYGEEGNRQQGIDVLAYRASTKKYTVCQCKRVRNFGPALLKLAVEDFLKGEWSSRTDRFIIAVQDRRRNISRNEAVLAATQDLESVGIEFQLWDGETLDLKLKPYPDLVSDHFGENWATAFCPTRRTRRVVPLSRPVIAFTSLAFLGLMYVATTQTTKANVYQNLTETALGNQRSSLPSLREQQARQAARERVSSDGTQILFDIQPKVAVPSASAVDMAVSALYNNGVRLQAISDAPEAITNYAAAIGLNGQFAKAYSNRGAAYQSIGNVAKALSDLDTAVRLDPNSDAALTNRGLARIDAKNPVGAKSDLVHALKINPASVEASANLAVLLSRIGDQLGALSKFNSVIRGGRYLDKLYFNKGYVESLLSKKRQEKGEILQAKTYLDAAISDYSRSLRISGGYLPALINRGLEYHRRGDKALAYKDVNTALRLDLRSIAAYKARASMRFDDQQYSEAVDDCTAALRLNPGFGGVLNNRGNAYLSLGKLREARSDFEAASKAGSADGFNNLGTMKQAAKDYEGAIEDYTAAIGLQKDFLEAYVNRSGALILKSRIAEALSDLKYSVERIPSEPAVHFNFACAYAHLKDYPKALRSLGEAFLWATKNGSESLEHLREDAIKEPEFRLMRDMAAFKVLVKP